ncbi:MAG: hypothetical protein HYU29_06070, partial [Chloroflexi bacterium]|nr:hypothetical protein [Chloroflexota bacterium]
MGLNHLADSSEKKNTGGWLALLASFTVPALVVAGLMVLLLNVQTGAQAATDRFATLLPVGYAFAAGMVASVNPCGFFLLPSYISYHLGTEEANFYRTPMAVRLAKALLLGAVATLGFILIFAAAGTVISLGGRWLIRFFPYAGVAIGVFLASLGLWLLVTHRSLGIAVAGR